MLIVGTNTYIDEAGANDYLTLIGAPPLSDPVALLIRATNVLDTNYGGRLIGTKRQYDQKLAFPRFVEGTDGFGDWRDWQFVPIEVQKAQVEIAIALDSGLDPFAQPEPYVLQDSVKVDVIEQSRTFSAPFRPQTLWRADSYMRPFLLTGSIRLVR